MATRLFSQFFLFFPHRPNSLIAEEKLIFHMIRTFWKSFNTICLINCVIPNCCNIAKGSLSKACQWLALRSADMCAVLHRDSFCKRLTKDVATMICWNISVASEWQDCKGSHVWRYLRLVFSLANYRWKHAEEPLFTKSNNPRLFCVCFS